MKERDGLGKRKFMAPKLNANAHRALRGAPLLVHLSFNLTRRARVPRKSRNRTAEEPPGKSRLCRRARARSNKIIKLELCIREEFISVAPRA